MTPIAGQLAGMAISYVAALLTKKMSKANSSVVHEWLAPAVAGVAGIGYSAVTGGDLSPETFEAGLSTGAGAVFVHSIYYGLKNRKARS